jgi:tRNA A-37 threonylcarbamoyl transferase component Bud32
MYIYDPAYNSPALKALLENPDQAIAASQMPLLKNDATTTLGIVSIDGRLLAIKRYNIKGFWHAVKRSIRPSRAAICWEHGQTLLSAGISTPHPVAMIEKRFGFFRSTAYFINEYVQGAVNVGDYFGNPTEPLDTVKIAVAERIAQIFKQFAEKGIAHGDLKTDNILIVNHQPILLDLDSMRLYPNRGWYFQREHKKDIQRFLKDWVRFPVLKRLFQQLLKND